MNRLFESQLNRIELDYAETILAGQRADARRQLDESRKDLLETPVLYADEENVESLRNHVLCEYVQIEDSPRNAADDEPNIELVPTLSPNTCCVPTQPDSPLTEKEVAQIKAHMATVKPKYEPKWANSISDKLIIEMLRKQIS